MRFESPKMKMKRTHGKIGRAYFGSRSDAARWVRDSLRIQIIERSEGALLARGDSLPSEDCLCATFGVSRNAIRESLDLLRQEGLVERIPGVGTILKSSKICQRLDRLKGLSESLEGSQLSVTNGILAGRDVSANSFVAQKLGVPEGTPVVFVERLRIVDGTAFSLDDSYVRTDVVQDLLGADLLNRDLFSLLEELQQASLGWAEIKTEAVAADESTAEILCVDVGSPLLLVHRMVYLDDGTPLDLEVVRYRGDRSYLCSTLRRNFLQM